MSKINKNKYIIIKLIRNKKHEYYGQLNLEGLEFNLIKLKNYLNYVYKSKTFEYQKFKFKFKLVKDPIPGPEYYLQYFISVYSFIKNDHILTIDYVFYNQLYKFWEIHSEYLDFKYVKGKNYFELYKEALIRNII